MYVNFLAHAPRGNQLRLTGSACINLNLNLYLYLYLSISLSLYLSISLSIYIYIYIYVYIYISVCLSVCLGRGISPTDRLLTFEQHSFLFLSSSSIFWNFLPPYRYSQSQSMFQNNALLIFKTNMASL